MTAKLSPDSIGLIFTMHATGHQVEAIADAAGCSYPTVVRYLNAAGIVLGNKGSPKRLTAEYLEIALHMRSKGKRWVDIERKTGFCKETFRGEFKAMSAQQ